MTTHTVDQVITKYIEIRDALDARRHEYQEYEKKAKEAMERLSMWLRDRGDELGVDSFRTSAGTAFKVEKKSVRVGEWQQVLDYIKRTGNWHMLEKRLAKLATLEVLSEEQIDPADIGINLLVDVEYQVRKPTGKDK